MLYLIYIWPGLRFHVVHMSILQVKAIVSPCHDVTNGLQKILSLCIPDLKVDRHKTSTFCRGTFSNDSSSCVYNLKLRTDPSKILAKVQEQKNASADHTEDIYSLPIGQLGSARFIIYGRAFLERLRTVQSYCNANAKTT